MSGLEQRLSLSRGKDLRWYTAGGRCTLCVSFGGRETPVIVSRVLGDNGMAPAAGVLRRRYECEPIVMRGLRIRKWVVVFCGGGE
jgi:hypothetical protein